VQTKEVCGLAPSHRNMRFMFTADCRYLLKVFQSWETAAMWDDDLFSFIQEPWLLVATNNKRSASACQAISLRVLVSSTKLISSSWTSILPISAAPLQTLCKLFYNMCDMKLFLRDRLKKCC